MDESTYTRSENDYKDDLGRQIEFLIRSSKDFDDGYFNEAIRLAGVIRTVFELRRNFNMKSVKYLDTASEYHPNDIGLPHFGLVGILFDKDKGPIFYAPLDDVPATSRGPHLKPYTNDVFHRWQNKPIVVDPNKNTFSRKDLILSVANKDGGAHIAPKLEEKYAKLTRFNSMGWNYIINGKDTGMIKYIELASIRQIAHEMITSFRDVYPEYFEELKYTPKSVNERFTTVPFPISLKLIPDPNNNSTIEIGTQNKTMFSTLLSVSWQQ